MSGLALDLWQVVFFFLDEPDVVRLQRCGDRALQWAIERRGAAFLPRRHFPASTWPRSISSSQYLRHIDAHMRYNLPSAFTTLPPPLEDEAWSPRLISLSLTHPNSPFLVSSPDSVRGRMERLRRMFPVLLDLRCYHSGGGGYWALPPTLTHFSGSRASMSDAHLLTLPLQSLDIHSIDCEGLDWASLPPTLEKLAIYHNRGAPLFPAHLASSLKSLKVRARFPTRSPIAEGHLTALLNCVLLETLEIHAAHVIPKGGSSGFSWDAWLPRRLTSLHLERPIPVSQYAQLPRTLTKVTHLHKTGRIVPQKWCFDEAESCKRRNRDRTSNPTPRGTTSSSLSSSPILLLPPSLTHVSFASQLPSHYDHNDPLEPLTYYFPGLVSLDMRWTPVDASQFSYLPPTLTRLHFHHITLGKVLTLSNKLPRLTDLSIYAGTLTKAIAKALPRSLLSLTLSHVSLVVKGHHHPEGDPSKATLYSATSNPQLGAFTHLPPTLTSFSLFPAPSFDHAYWATFLAPILQRLPFADSLQTLILDFGWRVKTAEIPVLWKGPPDGMMALTSPLAPTQPDAFSRFSQLRHLFLECLTLEPHNGEILHHLPPSLCALHLPPQVWNSAKWIPPKAIKVFPSPAPAHLPSTFPPATLAYANAHASDWTVHGPGHATSKNIDDYAHFPSCYHSPPISCRSKPMPHLILPVPDTPFFN